jgi:hypothetical protein
LGTIGDWIGGTAAPLLNFAAFIVLLVSINYQREEMRLARIEYNASMNELREQREVQKQQKFETTFFNLINLHSELTKNVKNGLKGSPSSGDVFQQLNRHISVSYKQRIVNYSPTNGEEAIDSNYEALRTPVKSSYMRSESVLGPYTRNMASIFKSICSVKNSNDRLTYLDIYISQLSSDELVWLFYFRIFSTNENFLKGWKELGIAEQISGRSLINPAHYGMFNKDFDPIAAHHKWYRKNNPLTKIDPPKIPPVEPPNVGPSKLG